MNFFNRFKKAEPELIPVPEKFPSFNNVAEWMKDKVNYYEKKYPEKMYTLFCPTFADYLPLNVTAGTSSKVFHENLKQYRELKERFPEAVLEAKKHNFGHCIFNGGDPEDYV